MTHEFFLYEKPRSHVARITINRPERRNAVHPAAHREWAELLDDAAADHDVWLVVITGAGDDAFCAGRDLKQLAEMSRASASEREAEQAMLGSVKRLVERFDYPKPLVARVNGAALGGGFEVVLACDIAIAADHATFGLPEPRRGIFAGGGGVHRLPRQIPLKLAMGFLLTGRTMSAAEALGLGLLNEVAPPGGLDEAVDRWIDDIMECAPLSVRATKQAAMRGLDLTLEQAFAGDYPAVAAMRASEDATEGPRAFAEKRQPRWSGR